MPPIISDDMLAPFVSAHGMVTIVVGSEVF